MKIVFAGTPDFAKQHLEMVLDSKHNIVGVLTQPDRKSGRGKKIQSSAVKELALKLFKLLRVINHNSSNSFKNFVD